MNLAVYFAESAAQCRRLAAAVTDDRAVEMLSELAAELETMAGERASREMAKSRNADPGRAEGAIVRPIGRRRRRPAPAPE